MIRKLLLGCGVASFVLYVGMNIASALMYTGCDVFSQEVSELSAIGAPTRSWWVPVGVEYEILVIALAWVSGYQPIEIGGCKLSAASQLANPRHAPASSSASTSSWI